MPEVSRPLLPVETNYVCDSCGTGYMQRPSGALEAASEKGFVHVCNYCGTEAFLNEVYPKRDYVNFYGFLQDGKAAIAAAKKRSESSE